MNAPKVSVVVPVFNAARTLQQALTSVADSSYANLEAILIDDGSVDGSVAVADSFARRDSRFRCLRNEANRGVSFSRNRGMAAATGTHLLFLDSDDWISPDWIGHLAGDAAATGAEVIIGRSRRVRGGRESDYRMKGLTRRRALRFEQAPFKADCVVWNKLYAVDLLKREGIRFDESLTIGEDLLFNYQALGLARGLFNSGRGFYFHRADNARSIIRSSTPAERDANLSRLLDRLGECARALERKHPAVLRKVARDILINRYRCLPGFPEDETMWRIRALAPWLPAQVRLGLWWKAARRRVCRRARPGRADGAPLKN